MRRTLIALATALLLPCWLCCAGRVATAEPSPGPHAVLHYEVIEVATHKTLYTLRGWSEAARDDPDHTVAVSQLAFPGGSNVDIRVIFTHDEPPRCVSWEAVVRDRSGATVASSHERFVPDAFPLLSEPVPANTYPPLAPLGYVLTRLGLGSKRTASFHFILMGTSLLQMDLWVDGRDTIEVPAGRFECYRVRMRVNPASLFPHLPGLLEPFVRFFIPTHTIWLTTTTPQALVKYTGQMGPPGSPDLLIQLTRIDAAGPGSSETDLAAGRLDSAGPNCYE